MTSSRKHTSISINNNSKNSCFKHLTSCFNSKNSISNDNIKKKAGNSNDEVSKELMSELSIDKESPKKSEKGNMVNIFLMFLYVKLVFFS